MSSVNVAEAWIVNTTPIGTAGANQSWIFQGTSTVTTETTISTTKTHTFGLSLAVTLGGKIGIPFVAEGEAESTLTASYQYATATEDSTADTKTTGFTWSQLSAVGNVLMPGQGVHCTASAIQGTFNSDYSSTVQFVVRGKTFSFQQRGTFQNTSYTTAHDQCTVVAIGGIPPNTPTTPATSTTSKMRERTFEA